MFLAGLDKIDIEMFWIGRIATGWQFAPQLPKDLHCGALRQARRTASIRSNVSVKTVKIGKMLW